MIEKPSVRGKRTLWRGYAALEIRFSYLIATWLVRLRYWPFLSIGRGCYFQRNVVFKPFLWREGRLMLTLKGKNIIGQGTVFQGSGTIEFGERSFCAGNCVFASNAAIRIGNDVMIADAVAIRDSDHGFQDVDRPMIDQAISIAPVTIEDDVWIGHGAVILKGVHIGKGSIIAAGAVVTRDVAAGEIVAGVPARRIASRAEKAPA